MTDSFLKGPLAGKLFRFALPVAFTIICEQLVNATDVLILGKFVGADAMAAVGNDMPVISLLISLLVGLPLGSNVLLAQAIGGGNKAAARKILHTSLLFSVLIGGAFTLVGESITKAASQTDKRIKAVATLSMFNSGRVRRNGFQDKQIGTIQQRLAEASEARNEELKGHVEYVGFLPPHGSDQPAAAHGSWQRRRHPVHDGRCLQEGNECQRQGIVPDPRRQPHQDLLAA